MTNSSKQVTLMSVASILALSVWQISYASVFEVDRNDDPFPGNVCNNEIANDCSLRDAVIAANNNNGPDIIKIPAGTFILDRQGVNEDAAFTGDLDITDAVSIQGDGMSTTIIEANGASSLLDRVFQFHISASGAEINDLTIQGGREVWG